MADIHANLWALEAVLDHAQRHNASHFLNLGDISYGPLKPRATFDRLMKEDVAMTIQGNQDRLLYQATTEEVSLNPTLRFVLQDLGDEPIAWLRRLPKTAVYEKEIFLCHGTPASDMEYLLEDVTSGKPEVRSEREIARLLGEISSPVIVCGHTHVPRVVRLSSVQLIVNPGSVGLPAYEDTKPVPHAMEMFSPHACYAILERTRFGWDVSLERVAYDHEAAAQQARVLGREDWAHALATGRVV